jgi:hypothetical protein
VHVTDIHTGLTQERLHQLFLYDPDAGTFTRKIRVGKKGKVGMIAGHVRDGGYHYVKIDSRNYLASRLAWLYMTGEWPQNDIDHINEDKADTRWVNLRAATRTQNQANRGPTCRCKTGYKGVFRVDRKANPFRAAIRVSGRLEQIGVFPTAEEANAAYVNRAQELYGEFARGTA